MLLGMACVTYAQEMKPNRAEEVPLTDAKARVYGRGTEPGPERPIRLGPGPHLLIDGFLIESSSNVRRVVNGPKRDPSMPNPIVTGKEDGCFQPYMTILRDPASGRFRIWYGRRVEDGNAGRSHIGYMESDDGIHWVRPARVLQDPAPIQFGVSVVDDGPACPNPAQRFKLAWYMDGGLKLATSPDGLAWTPLAADPVIGANHDITGLFYDPLRQRYVATVSVYRTGDAWSGNRRVTMHSFSKDLAAWTTPHYVLLPNDSTDPGETQFYAMDGYLARGDLIIGMVKVLRDELKADNPPDPPDAYGMGYTTLAWTRDGETWWRDQEHFFDPDPKKGAWDHAHAWIDDELLVGDNVYLYYGGYARGHKVNRFEERQIGLVKIKRDRYAGWQAGDQPGTIVTPVVVLDGTGIELNVNAAVGTVRAQVLDEAKRSLPGFAFADCSPVTGDALAAPLTWKQPLASLKGKPARLEFSLKNACLFALEVK